MYSELWSPRLRQGDVIGPVSLPFLGKKLQVVSTAGNLAGTPGAGVESVLVPVKPRYVAVVSHDCEFNEGKREYILLARIQRLDPRLTPEEIEDIRLSNDVKGRHATKQEVDGVDSFLIDPIEGHIGGPQVISFTALMPYPTTPEMLASLLERKRAELVHEQRLLMKQKLAWFFLRGDDDVPAEEKRPKEEVIAAREAVATAEPA
jgi:hypothetical protein